VKVEQVPSPELRKLEAVYQLCINDLVELGNGLELENDRVVRDDVFNMHTDIHALVNKRINLPPVEEYSGVRRRGRSEKDAMEKNKEGNKEEGTTADWKDLRR
jgi:hypothetical protein